MLHRLNDFAEKYISKELQQIHLHEHYGSGSAQTRKFLPLKAFRFGNDGEYCSYDLKTFLAEHGIQHQPTVAHFPNQN